MGLTYVPQHKSYRVYHRIQDTTYQEWFKATEKFQAERRNAELEALKAESLGEWPLRSDGGVIGIRFRYKTGKEDSDPTPVFEVSLKSSVEQRIINTSRSILRSGLVKAWEDAVNVFAKHARIDPDSELYLKVAARMNRVLTLSGVTKSELRELRRYPLRSGR